VSGHSKWAQTKHKKAVVDAKRGKIFTKIIKEMAVAARMGGGDPDANPRLRTAIAGAKAVNMPQENIVRAIKRGTGELEGVSYESVNYEGYGPGGVAVLVEALTDNRNRTTSEVRHLFSKNNGSMGESGCVSWLFHQQGYFLFERESVDEDLVMELALEAGAEDVREEETRLEVISAPSDFEGVKKAFDDKRLNYLVAEVTLVPQTYVKLTGKEAEQMLRLINGLEDCDDVQHAYANFDIPDEMIEAFKG
jgi:YebC/PmpR family DNA-binding regulatory protein